jgi:soluble lytic murein transglycosylase-like protein
MRVANRSRSRSTSHRAHRPPGRRCSLTLLVTTITCGLVFCSGSIRPATAAPPEAPPTEGLASDPADLAVDLVADEKALRDPSSSEEVLHRAASRQQAAYRAIGWHPEWDPTVRPAIPPSLLDAYDHNIDARHQLSALVAGHLKDTLPAWRIEPPAAADELLGYYHTAEAATGVDWNHLAAINLIETGFGRIAGISEAGAQGPMQFMPATFATYGDGGDILSPPDAIMAAGRLLAANGFAGDHAHAIYQYNHSDHYVQAVEDYAAVLASDPAAFAGYYRWDIYYRTTAGDVRLPVGYAATSRIPASDYLASHPQ